MKIQIASDLHREFYAQNDPDWSELVASFAGEADVLVLAGDIVPLINPEQIRSVFAPFCERYKHVVYVWGNHELYQTSPFDARVALHVGTRDLKNFHFLKNELRTIGGQKFYGGTMWFPDLPMNWKWKPRMNDFQLIRDLEPWVYEENREFHAGFAYVDRDTVVVSHHLPSMGSTPERYRSHGFDSLNAFFVDAFAPELAMRHKPKFWIHGHTHTACDWVLDETRVVCNPFGYPGENDDPVNHRIVEI